MKGTLPLKEKAACATYKTKQQEIVTIMLPLGNAQILQCFMFVPYKEDKDKNKKKTKGSNQYHHLYVINMSRICYNYILLYF